MTECKYKQTSYKIQGQNFFSASYYIIVNHNYEQKLIKSYQDTIFKTKGIYMKDHPHFFFISRSSDIDNSNLPNPHI